MKPIIAITMGDAAGVGPEIIIKALENKAIYDQCSPLVIGDSTIFTRVLKFVGSKLAIHSISETEEAKYEQGTLIASI
jgi:4-phospho-D-threonate 3-dehydrogenase / 4-phospho-D-erythronate 3-dehydrogenase